MPTGLMFSDQQRTILMSILEDTRTVEWAGGRVDQGVPWRPGTNRKGWTPAKRAACSRALSRLERRGLVVRLCYPGRHRAMRVALTDRGWQVAGSLIDDAE